MEGYLFIPSIFQDDLALKKADVHSTIPRKIKQKFVVILEIILDRIDKGILEQVWRAIEMTAHALTKNMISSNLE